ncbi:MAG: HesA/MoeB/ThiF family protein [Promethearchaeota archaeon]|nr:MAG: HesA/MoeB/ThiF family protein [Candidatus Lokiarchaeota archaeon]
MRINNKLNIKILDKILKLRYEKQPKLRKIKKKLLSRQIAYKDIIDQESRNYDNDLLDETEKSRWDRQIRHPLINQMKIKNAKIVVFGCGGIGSNVLLGLVYAGVYNFKILDFDKINYSNLNRQTLYTPKDVNNLKIDKAKERLSKINPEVKVDTFNMEIYYPLDQDIYKIEEKNYSKEVLLIDNLIKWADYIVIALDYFGSPYLINDLCIKNKKPFYWGGVNHFLGDLFNYDPNNNSACLRCIFGKTDFINKTQFLRYKTKEDSFKGVNLGTTVIVTGNLISELIIRDICSIKNPFHGNYLIYDAYNFEIINIPIERDSNCICQNLI